MLLHEQAGVECRVVFYIHLNKGAVLVGTAACMTIMLIMCCSSQLKHMTAMRTSQHAAALGALSDIVLLSYAQI